MTSFARNETSGAEKPTFSMLFKTRKASNTRTDQNT